MEKEGSRGTRGKEKRTAKIGIMRRGKGEVDRRKGGKGDGKVGGRGK